MNMRKKKTRPVHAGLNSQLIRRSMQRWFPLFLLPTFIAFCIGFLWPFLQGIYLSFFQFKTLDNMNFAGLQNYLKAFGDASFVSAFWQTAKVAVVSIILINLFAFAVAYALTRGIRGANLFRSMFFMPNLIGGIVLGYIWNTIFAGVLRGYNTALALNSTLGFWGLIIVLCWQQVGYMMIIYIAGLQSVSEDMIEAARIDGANSWHVLRHITLPTVMPSITICTFLTLTNSFKLFDQNLVLTNGAPMVFDAGQQIYTTEMLALNIYRTFTMNWKWQGVGQAKAVMFFILVAGISLFQLSATRSREVQQ
jgi:raffinose/stachyose/melibiose transport system permease protein